ncbi:MAG: primosomal protein N', partial [Clostridia bacterium]|nr:primosomal protein N' [Clostridia bacterium]
DFRANERGFSLFTQVCGRAGRGELKGRAVIQTYQPFNSTIRFSKEHDYISFYESEIIQRKRLNYPPFCDIIYIMVSGEDEALVKEKIEGIGKVIEKKMGENEIFSKVGPAPAPIAKIKNSFRYRILLKCRDAEPVHGLLCTIYEEHEKSKADVHLTIDINPINMY